MNNRIAEIFAPKIRAALEQDWHNVVELSEFIHSHVEESSKEFDCCARLVVELEDHGFAVERGIAGMDTAFRASFGSDSAATTVAFVCEYDGLPPYGQSCGHNVVAAASYGAALALRPFAYDLDLRLLVIGTPAEEGVGGKYILGDAGIFDDVDFATSIYPGMDDISASRTLAAQRLTVESFGKPAHGAAHPELGINALDGIVLGFSAMAMLRPNLPPTARIHGIINEGGIHPQVVPDYARATVVVRAADLTELAEIRARVTYAFQQAVEAVGATCTVTPAERCAEAIVGIEALASLFDAALCAVGRSPTPTDEVSGAWSTDAGTLSRRVPYLQPQVKMTPRSIPPHSHAFHEASIGPDSESCIFDAAIALASMAAEFASNPDIRTEVESQFRAAVTGAS
ncbi:peptidase dimerization domain-containing protein [Mycolicibacterium mengxianglii]|uniref:peptidase dimerization domain-containing protein n=1 Tax=Mycolicibacterium mengxianglii TaxID=2736649 RepID=UPI0018EEE009|nr:peptidase dimerization domain-containing protein [Mycolicibacterium mengxianglii]